MGMKEIVLGLIGVIVAIVLIGGVAIPLIYSPTLPVAASGANSTALGEVNATAPKEINFTLTDLDASEESSVTIAYTALSAPNNITASIGATVLGNLTGGIASPATLTIPANTLTATTKIVFTSTAGSGGNVTGATLNYYQNSEASGWNPAVRTFWTVLVAIVLVAALLLYVMKEW